MTPVGHDVMSDRDGAIQPYEGQIVPSGAHIALRQQAVFEGLLPAPHSAITFRPDGPGLAQRAIEGIAHGALTYKAVLITPLLAPFIEGAAGALHSAAHSAAIGAGMIGAGTLAGGVGTILSLAHITNPPDPHHIGTHHAGHAGKIIATAFGLFLLAVAEGVTTWLGPLSGGSWAVGIPAALTGMLVHAMRIHESGGHREIRGTDRIRAVAELAAATSATGQMPYAPPPTPANHHPLTQQVLYALSIEGFPGGTVDAMPVVVNPNRWSLTVNLPEGVTPAKVKAREAEIASTLQVVAGGLTIAPGAGSHQIAVSVNNVAVADIAPAGAHPIVELEACAAVSVWAPVHLGTDDDGADVGALLAGRPGILIAGAPGSGKSNATAQVVCTVVRASDCELWTIDGSGRELVIFDRVARYHSRFDLDEAIDLLSLLREEINRRGEILADHRATEFTRELAEATGTKAVAYVIGELSYYTADDSQPKKSKEFNTHLRDIVSRGRACAVFGILDTQKPEDRTVPSAIRDMVPLKLALRCETEEQVVTILGRGMQKLCPAHTDRLPLDEEGKSLGFGYLKGIPGRAPFRLRTHRITAEERYAIVDAHGPQVTDEPPDGPGGGHREPTAAKPGGWRGTHLRPVPCYPDGERIGENYVALWESLDAFPDGFTYRDVAAAGVMKGRGSVQGPLDMWRNSGYIAACGERRGRSGPSSTVWRKVEPDVFGRGREAG